MATQPAATLKHSLSRAYKLHCTAHLPGERPVLTPLRDRIHTTQIKAAMLR